MMTIVLDWGFVCVDGCNYFMSFGRRLRSIMWACPWHFHWVEKPGCKEPKNMSRSCGE